MKGTFLQCIACSGSCRVWRGEGCVECKHCLGAGRNWLYPSGLIAKYYGGPIIGRATPSEMKALEQSEKT